MLVTKPNVTKLNATNLDVIKLNRLKLWPVANRQRSLPKRQLAALLLGVWLPVCPSTSASPVLNLVQASLPAAKQPIEQTGRTALLDPTQISALTPQPAAGLLLLLSQLQQQLAVSPENSNGKVNAQLQHLWQQSEALWLQLFRQGQDRQLNRLYNQLQVSWQLYQQHQPAALRQHLPLVQQQLLERQQQRN